MAWNRIVLKDALRILSFMFFDRCSFSEGILGLVPASRSLLLVSTLGFTSLVLANSVLMSTAVLKQSLKQIRFKILNILQCSSFSLRATTLLAIHSVIFLKFFRKRTVVNWLQPTRLPDKNLII